MHVNITGNVEVGINDSGHVPTSYNKSFDIIVTRPSYELPCCRLIVLLQSFALIHMLTLITHLYTCITATSGKYKYTSSDPLHMHSQSQHSCSKLSRAEFPTPLPRCLVRAEDWWRQTTQISVSEIRAVEGVQGIPRPLPSRITAWAISGWQVVMFRALLPQCRYEPTRPLVNTDHRRQWSLMDLFNWLKYSWQISNDLLSCFAYRTIIMINNNHSIHHFVPKDCSLRQKVVGCVFPPAFTFTTNRLPEADPHSSHLCGWRTTTVCHKPANCE